MGRVASDATLLRQARSELRATEIALCKANARADEFRVRATKAEQEVAAWKTRFDLLLIAQGTAGAEQKLGGA